MPRVVPTNRTDGELSAPGDAQSTTVTAVSTYHVHAIDATTIYGCRHYHARERMATTYMTQAKTFTVDAPRRGRAEGGPALRIVRMRPKRRGGLRNDEKSRGERRGGTFYRRRL